MKHQQLRAVAIGSLASLLVLPTIGLAQWSIEDRDVARATLQELAGRATLVIQCSQEGADPAVHLHQPLVSTHVALTYRFDDDEAKTLMVPVSQSGKVLQIWSEEEKQNFARAKRLRIQLRPFVVFDFDLRGIETVAAKLQCR